MDSPKNFPVWRVDAFVISLLLFSRVLVGWVGDLEVLCVQFQISVGEGVDAVWWEAGWLVSVLVCCVLSPNVCTLFFQRRWCVVIPIVLPYYSK